MPNRTQTSSLPTIKLQKVMADSGVASRRKAEQLIDSGRVKVDGEVATIGTRVNLHQTISVDGKDIRVNRSKVVFPRVLVMNKSVGVEVSTRPSSGRKSVFDSLPSLKRGRWISIGRLDLNTSGLLLFTDSGELANRLMHPREQIDREYAVRINRLLDDEALKRLLTGIEMDGELLQFSDIQHYDGRGVNHWYHVCLMQGRNREVRHLFESEGIMVSRLKRVRYGPFFLPSFVGIGRVAEVHPEEVKAVCDMLGFAISPLKAQRPGTSRKKRSFLLQYEKLRLPSWSAGNEPS